MFKISNLTIHLNNEISLEEAISKKYRVNKKDVSIYRIIKKSIDARDQEDIKFIYSVYTNIKNYVIKKYDKNIVIDDNYELKYLDPIKVNKKANVAIVGYGPCGIFSALNLSKANVNVTVIERGKKVEERIKDVEELFLNHTLNKESNVSYGEGGAGTFSDGKLNTGVNDKYAQVVYNEFVKYGANKEIIYDSHPHIGSDVLRNVLINIRKDLENKVNYLFEHTLIDLESKNNKVILTLKNKEEIIKKEYDYVILAIGHNPYETFKMLYNKGMQMEAKPFSMGVRIEHLQKNINMANYGRFYNHPLLKASNYKLAVHLKNGRSVYTFCMCPGGVVVPSQSDEESIVTNGMSYYARDKENANSALLVNVTPLDYDNHPLGGFEFQRKYERKAYELSNSYKAPTQLVKDFLKDRVSTEFKSVKASYYGGTVFRNLKDCLPDFVYESLKMALPKLNLSLKGFNDPEAVLTGIESRSSSPTRLIRTNFESSLENVFVAGEGSGYSGGITTSAIDGIKCSNEIINRINNKNNI